MFKENSQKKASVPTNSHTLSGKQTSTSIYKRTKKVPLSQHAENVGIGDHLVANSASPAPLKSSMTNESTFGISGTETTPIIRHKAFNENFIDTSGTKTTPKMTVGAFVSGVEQRLAKKNESSNKKIQKKGRNVADSRHQSAGHTRVSANKNYQEQIIENEQLAYYTPLRGQSFVVEDCDLSRTGTTAKNDDRRETSASISFGHEHLKEIMCNKSSNVVLAEKENPMGMALRHLGRGFGATSDFQSRTSSNQKSATRDSSNKNKQLPTFLKRSITKPQPQSTQHNSSQKKTVPGSFQKQPYSRQKDSARQLPPAVHQEATVLSPSIDHFYNCEESHTSEPVNLQVDNTHPEKNTDLEFLMNPVQSPDMAEQKSSMFQTMDAGRRDELSEGWQILTIDPKNTTSDFFGQPVSFRPIVPHSLQQKQGNSRQQIKTCQSMGLNPSSHRKDDAQESPESSPVVAVSTSLVIPRIMDSVEPQQRVNHFQKQMRSNPNLNLDNSSQFTMNQSSSTCRTPDTIRRKRCERKSSRGSITPCQANVQYALLAQNTLRRAIYRRLKHSQEELSPRKVGINTDKQQHTPSEARHHPKGLHSSTKKRGMCRSSSKKSMTLMSCSSKKHLVEINVNLRDKAAQQPILSTNRTNQSYEQSIALYIPQENHTFREGQDDTLPLESANSPVKLSPVKLLVNLYQQQENSYDQDGTLMCQSSSLVKTCSPSLVKSPSPYSRHSSHSSPLRVTLQPIGLSGHPNESPMRLSRKSPMCMSRKSPLKHPDFMSSASSSPAVHFHHSRLLRQRSSPAMRSSASPSKNPVTLLKLQLIKEANCARSIQRAFRRTQNILMTPRDAALVIQRTYRAHTFRQNVHYAINQNQRNRYNLKQVVEAWRTRRALNCLAVEVQEFVNCEVESRRERLRLQFHLLFEQVLDRKLYLEKNAPLLQRLQRQSNSLLARTYSSTDDALNNSPCDMQSQAPTPMQYMNLMPYYESKSSLDGYAKNTGKQVPQKPMSQTSQEQITPISDPVSPMNFSNEQEMLVQRIDSEQSPEKGSFSPMRDALIDKKQKYGAVQQLIIQEQEEPPSSVYFDSSSGVVDKRHSQQRSASHSAEVSGNQSQKEVSAESVLVANIQIENNKPQTDDQYEEELQSTSQNNEHNRNMSGDDRMRSLQKVESKYKEKIKQVRHRVDCWNDKAILRDESCGKSSQNQAVICTKKVQNMGSEGKMKQASYSRSRVEERLSCFKEAVRQANQASIAQSHDSSEDETPLQAIALQSTHQAPKNVSQTSLGIKSHHYTQDSRHPLPTTFGFSPSQGDHPTSSPNKPQWNKSTSALSPPQHSRSTSVNVSKPTYMTSHKSSPQLRPYTSVETPAHRVTLERLHEVMERVQNPSSEQQQKNRLTNGRPSTEQLRFISLTEAERQFKRLLRDLEDQFDELKLKQIIGE